jgi:hypothetical protein
VVGPGVLLHDVESVQLDLQRGAAAAAAGEPDGVDHAVVGQRGRRIPVLGCGFGEAGQHDLRGDPGVGGDVQGVAGVVVEPGDDLHVGTGGAVGVGEPVVGEVGLPGLVRLVGFEPEVGALRSLRRVRDDLAIADQDPVDRGPRQVHLMVVFQVPADGVGTGVEPGVGQLLAQP